VSRGFEAAGISTSTKPLDTVCSSGAPGGRCGGAVGAKGSGRIWGGCGAGTACRSGRRLRHRTPPSRAHEARDRHRCALWRAEPGPAASTAPAQRPAVPLIMPWRTGRCMDFCNDRWRRQATDCPNPPHPNNLSPPVDKKEPYGVPAGRPPRTNHMCFVGRPASED
jgi:hypothetical protein